MTCTYPQFNCDCGQCREKREADLRVTTDIHNKLYFLASGGEKIWPPRIEKEEDDMAGVCGNCGLATDDGESVCPRCHAEAQELRADIYNENHRLDGPTAERINRS